MTPQDHIREAQTHLKEAGRLLALEAAGVKMKDCFKCGGDGGAWNVVTDGWKQCPQCEGMGKVSA